MTQLYHTNRTQEQVHPEGDAQQDRPSGGTDFGGTIDLPGPARHLESRIEARTARVGVIGMGYVGLPLAVATFEAGFPVTGFDIDPQKVEMLQRGVSPIRRFGDDTIAAMLAADRFEITGDYGRLGACDIVIICVPTPLTRHREPDLSYVVRSCEGLLPHLRAGQMVCLESTTYPGTTSEVVKPVLEESGLRAGYDFFLVYSPEREDPGNKRFSTAAIPKVVGGDEPVATRLGVRFYGAVVERIVPVSGCNTAEAVKLTENIFRSVNIALVNELKHIYAQMGIDVWEVIDAAKTKPFGYMAFYPGPGLGGHCIPIDPFYLAWKAREHDLPVRFIELAGEINTLAPYRVVDALIAALSDRLGKAINGARILLIGVAYKKNVEDVRESPAFKLIELIEQRGGRVDYYDPFVPMIPTTREHAELAGKRSLTWDPRRFADHDAALICTDHDGIDFGAVLDAVPLVVDTRNALRDAADRRKIVMA